MREREKEREKAPWSLTDCSVAHTEGRHTRQTRRTKFRTRRSGLGLRAFHLLLLHQTLQSLILSCLVCSLSVCLCASDLTDGFFSPPEEKISSSLFLSLSLSLSLSLTFSLSFFLCPSTPVFVSPFISCHRRISSQFNCKRQSISCY